MLTSLFTFLGLALAFVVVEMTVTWLVARRLQNYGIVDVIWAVGFGPLAVLCYLNGHLASPISTTFVAMVLIWSLRLSGHLAFRVAKHHPTEDVRYAKLRTEWGSNADRKMLGFFLLQGVLQVVLAVHFPIVMLRPLMVTGPFGIDLPAMSGFLLWAAGVLGESVADYQLARFRADPANKGKVCQAGLWNYSRHPNYFFEWLVWVGYAVFALGSPWGWLGLIAPALMLHFLLNVTGIPMTEELSLKSKGDAYREYQRTTSAFVPWFKKSATSAGGSGH